MSYMINVGLQLSVSLFVPQNMKQHVNEEQNIGELAPQSQEDTTEDVQVATFEEFAPSSPLPEFSQEITDLKRAEHVVGEIEQLIPGRSDAEGDQYSSALGVARWN